MKNLLKREDETVEKVIKHCSLLKRTIVKEDFKDRHARERLNYGHTFAHAIEAVTDYQMYLHGEAVAIGMSCAAHLSERLGLTDAATVARQDALCLAAGLPISLPPLPTDKLIEAMEGDKKGTDGKINLILPQAIGDVLKIKDVEKSLIREILLTKMVG
jgi:3-dehydroquinate synthase